MINPHRGEIEAELDGKRYTLCLTLGALAALEHALGVESIVGLTNKIEQGRLSASDVLNIITAGLNGAGHEVTGEDVATMKTKGGPSGYVNIAMRLLQASFGAENET